MKKTNESTKSIPFEVRRVRSSIRSDVNTGKAPPTRQTSSLSYTSTTKTSYAPQE